MAPTIIRRALPNGWHTMHFLRAKHCIALQNGEKCPRHFSHAFPCCGKESTIGKTFSWDFWVASNRQIMLEQHIHNKAHHPGGFWTCIHQIKVNSLRLAGMIQFLSVLIVTGGTLIAFLVHIWLQTTASLFVSSAIFLLTNYSFQVKKVEVIYSNTSPPPREKNRRFDRFI